MAVRRPRVAPSRPQKPSCFLQGERFDEVLKLLPKFQKKVEGVLNEGYYRPLDELHFNERLQGHEDLPNSYCPLCQRWHKVSAISGPRGLILEPSAHYELRHSFPEHFTRRSGQEIHISGAYMEALRLRSRFPPELLRIMIPRR